MVYAAILGYGTVGSGVATVLEQNKEMIAKKAGEGISVKYILDLRDFPGDPNENKVIHDFNIILEDQEVSVICGPELLRLARENNCNYLFEASVGGGIPIIRPMNYSLTGEEIDGITGILNGTTNYILSKMKSEGADFATVLKEAQERGYAEKNPEADVEGYDACRKIAILSSLMIGKTVNYEDIYTEGITKIDTGDFPYSQALCRSTKLNAMSNLTQKVCTVIAALS